MPSNPEQSFFQLAEAVLNIIKEKGAEIPKAKSILKVEIYAKLINYLATQVQDQLPYSIPGLDSNDKIFIGNEQFKQECNQMMDYLFDQILEEIAALNDVK